MGNKNNMRNVIIQNNEFLYNMTIVSILGVKHEEEDNVFAIFSEAELISGMEKIRKVEDLKFILITTEGNIY